MQSNKYSFEQLLAAQEFEKQRDALAAVLDKKKNYTKAEAKKLLQAFYEKGVK